MRISGSIVMALGVVFATAALAQTNPAAKPAAKPAPFTRYDLNGEWQAEFHDPGSVDVEKIMVVDYGGGLVATKETGDVYVPAGKVTFMGDYTGPSFKVMQQHADKGYVHPSFGPEMIVVKDADHFDLHYTTSSDVDHWQRIGKPTLALDDSILFDLNKYELRPDGATALAKVVAYLNQMHPKSHLLVAGYTDDTGSDALNMPLSEKRAQTVASVLKAKGIAAARLETRGFGKANPRYANVNDDARSHNRRVEIVIQD
ncbi:MAG TPA: OmpA family protein [Rhizomicrobium sp.]|nr:OmpA family protein [Rhizomicrobium sp.]